MNTCIFAVCAASGVVSYNNNYNNSILADTDNSDAPVQWNAKAMVKAKAVTMIWGGEYWLGL